MKELQDIIVQINHFPSFSELREMNRGDLLTVIRKQGGVNKFRELMRYSSIKKSNGYWTKEVIIKELKIIIKELSHFPTQLELNDMNKQNLSCAISRNGGFNVFRNLLGYEIIQKPSDYWTTEIIISELELVIKELNHFPLDRELREMNKSDLNTAIGRCGGLNKFRKLMKYEISKQTNGYWTEEVTIKELNLLIEKLGYFPTQNELNKMNRTDLSNGIDKNGGAPRIRELIGYPISMQEKYKSELSSYVGKRGRNSELLVKRIIQEWLKTHDHPELSCNVKLSSKNIIEFICNTSKTVGIDVTNTDTKHNISDKWKRKEYHKHLDELWIVVFSIKFVKDDYIKWNSESPENVIIVSIYEFLENLDYSTDIELRATIDKYKKCTFRNKGDFLNKSISDFQPKVLTK